MKRSEMSKEFMWDVENIFSSEDIEMYKKKCQELTEKIISKKGNINDVDTLLLVFQLENELSEILESLYVYFSHINDQDLSNSTSSGNLLMIGTFYHEIASKLSFVSSEILQIDEKKLKEFSNDKKLEGFKNQLDDLIEQKKYVLDTKSEEIISLANEAVSTSYEIYSTLVNAELKFDSISDTDMQTHPMNEAKWGQYSHSYDRELRKNAFISLMQGYENLKQTITMIYISCLKEQKFSSIVRGYKSPRFKSLYNNKIDEKIYDNLITSVQKNLDTNHRYIELRKKVLGYSELHLYDVYVPIVSDVNTKFDYNVAQNLVINALKVLGDDYVDVVKTSFKDNWIDVYPNDAKRSGAYSGGSYGSKPYVLLNYTDTLNDVFTLIHELGHSMHTFNTNKSQKFQNSHYKIFIAEIASTVNELLLFNYMLDDTKDIEIKKYLLNYNLDQFRTTVFRQTMFAEFESTTSELFMSNEMINEEILSNIYLELNKKYYGSAITIDELIKYEWLRIPHFYYNFYVYQYATSFCIATKIVKEILNGNMKMRDDYLVFLKLGDSVSPIDAIKTLGIDITCTEPIDDALNEYKMRLEQLEKLM